MEFPRLGFESELQLLAYTTDTATPDLSRVCNLHHSSQQHQILNPQSEARDGTRILLDTCRVYSPEPQGELPHLSFFLIFKIFINIWSICKVVPISDLRQNMCSLKRILGGTQQNSTHQKGPFENERYFPLEITQ